MQAFCEAYIAASQSGKSTLIRQRLGELRELPRVAVWDFKREYGSDVGELVSLGQLCDRMATKQCRAVFRPSFDQKERRVQFDHFCRIGIAAVYADHVPTLLVIEELAFVTTPAWAPPGWTQATCTGMGLGLSIIGSSQHPAQVDKQFFGNTTAIYCGTLTEPEHVDKMAKVLGVEREKIAHLPRYQFLYRHRDKASDIVPLSVTRTGKKKPLSRARTTP